MKKGFLIPRRNYKVLLNVILNNDLKRFVLTLSLAVCRRVAAGGKQVSRTDSAVCK